MTAAELHPLACAGFLIGAFTLAGFCQTAWLALPLSRRLAAPLDGGLTLFGRRIFGANKTLRGFVVMVPATGASFALLSALLDVGPAGAGGLWALSPAAYALVGLCAGLGFMAGELPNSFVKRQLDIAPGEAAGGRFSRPLFFVIDRIDSIAGMLIALALIVPVPASTGFWVLLVGPLLQGSFSMALFQLGVKARAA